MARYSNFSRIICFGNSTGRGGDGDGDGDDDDGDGNAYYLVEGNQTVPAINQLTEKASSVKQPTAWQRSSIVENDSSGDRPIARRR